MLADLIRSVFHFILLISRCCTCEPVNRSWKLRERIQEEEEVLLVLMERRRRLMEENEGLETRRGVGQRPLPAVPAEADGSGDEVEEEAETEQEDLIDMAAEEPEGNAHPAGEGNVQEE